jgi:hypothetical protein
MDHLSYLFCCHFLWSGYQDCAVYKEWRFKYIYTHTHKDVSVRACVCVHAHIDKRVEVNPHTLAQFSVVW